MLNSLVTRELQMKQKMMLPLFIYALGKNTRVFEIHKQYQVLMGMKGADWCNYLEE